MLGPRMDHGAWAVFSRGMAGTLVWRLLSDASFFDRLFGAQIRPPANEGGGGGGGRQGPFKWLP